MGLKSKSRTSLSSAPMFPSMKNTRANGHRWSMLPPSSSRRITRKAAGEAADKLFGLKACLGPFRPVPTRPMRHTGIGYTQQVAELPEIKAAFPAYQELHRQVLQDVLRRADKTFAA